MSASIFRARLRAEGLHRLKDVNFLRGILTVLGFALMALWIVGNRSNATYLAGNWLDLTAGVLSWIVASCTTPRTSRLGIGLSCLALFLGLLAVWLASLLKEGTAWQTWWSFTFAFAYGALGLGLVRGRLMPTPEHPKEGTS